jgi:ABC-2 type transport system ATP-binding protein
VAATQGSDPAGKLLLFAKIYDVAPDGSVTLVNRLISPTRVADVTKPVVIELPGVVHRYAAGHQIRVVVAATDAAYRNNTTVQPVTVLTSAAAPGLLSLPVLGGGLG